MEILGRRRRGKGEKMEILRPGGGAGGKDEKMEILRPGGGAGGKGEKIG